MSHPLVVSTCPHGFGNSQSKHHGIGWMINAISVTAGAIIPA